jgi:hypothetical protein
MNAYMPVIAAILLVALIVWFIGGHHRRRRTLTAGTVPGQFPGGNMVVGEIAVGNKLAVAAAFGSTLFFTAPVAGWYLLGWGVHIDFTDAAGTATLTMTPQGAPAIPGVQANLATGLDGHGPTAAYYLPQGGTVSGSLAVGSFGATQLEIWLFAQRLN